MSTCHLGLLDLLLMTGPSVSPASTGKHMAREPFHTLLLHFGTVCPILSAIHSLMLSSKLTLKPTFLKNISTRPNHHVARFIPEIALEVDGD